jgi:hypothetical protein
VRNWLLSGVALVGLAGCPPKTAAVVDTGPPKGHPDLHCPAGTVPNGYGPPVGREAWCEITLADGHTQKEGPTLSWHENGQRALSGNYAAGMQIGDWVTYYPTGTPESQGQYAGGKKEGVWVTWATSGEKIAEGPFVAGQEHGAWVFWDTATLSRSEGQYVLGGRDGTWLDISPEGKPTRERIYRGGRLLTQREL